MKLPSIQQVIQDSTRTLIRFPLVLFNAALGTVTALILVDYEGPPGPTVLFNILFATILGIPFWIAVALLVEKKKMRRSKLLIVYIVGIFLLVAYAFSVPSDISDAPNVHVFRLLILAAALHFFVAVAPFFGTGEINGFWHYNKTLVLRLLTAILYSVVLYAGLSVALAALDHLFGIDVPGKRYGELAILIYGLFTTWFFMAGIPDDLNSFNNSTDYPKALKIFAQYILFPIALVYLVILYAYLAKILIAWDWPQGWVSTLILGFSTTGILSLLLFHPIRDHVENVWIKTASRWFYVLMIPIVIMLFPALWRRISEYGITEGRYIAAALGVWLAIMVAYFILSKTKSIKIIPASLCVLAFLVSFGPWGVFNVSEKSQTERLKQLLEKNSILVDGVVRKAEASVPFEDTKQISSIISYLHDIHGYDRIQPWFRENLKQDSSGDRLTYKDPALVTKIMGVKFVKVWLGSTGNEIVLNADPEGSIDVEGYSKIIRTQYINNDRLQKDFPNEGLTYKVNKELDSITFTPMREGKAIDSLQISIRPLVDKLLKDYGNVNAGNIPPEKMVIDNANQSMKVKVYLQHLRLRRQGSDIKLVAYKAEFLYTICKQ
jgi:hypothetical protein